MTRRTDRRPPLQLAGLVVATGLRHVTFALQQDTLELQWHLAASEESILPWVESEGILIAAAGLDGVVVLDPRSGQRVRRARWGTMYGTASVAGSVLASVRPTRVFVGDVATGQELWSNQFDGTQGFATDAVLAMPKVVLFGVRGGGIVAVSLKTGKEVWRTSIADLTWEPVVGVVQTGEAREMVGYGDSVIVAVGIHHLVSLDLATGKRRWAREALARNILLVGDKLYAGPSTILSPATGRQIGTGFVKPPNEWAKAGICIVGGLAVSTTHGYAVTNTGAIVAWDWKTGEIAWSGRVAGAIGGFDTKLMIAAGRLYCSDSSNRLYCWEEIEPTDPVLRADRERARAEGRPTKLPARPIEIKEPTGRTPGRVGAGGLGGKGTATEVLDFSKEKASAPARRKDATPKRSVKVTSRGKLAPGPSSKATSRSRQKGKA